MEHIRSYRLLRGGRVEFVWLAVVAMLAIGLALPAIASAESSTLASTETEDAGPAEDVAESSDSNDGADPEDDDAAEEPASFFEETTVTATGSSSHIQRLRSMLCMQRSFNTPP